MRFWVCRMLRDECILMTVPPALGILVLQHPSLLSIFGRRRSRNLEKRVSIIASKDAKNLRPWGHVRVALRHLPTTMR